MKYVEDKIHWTYIVGAFKRQALLGDMIAKRVIEVLDPKLVVDTINNTNVPCDQEELKKQIKKTMRINQFWRWMNHLFMFFLGVGCLFCSVFMALTATFTLLLGAEGDVIPLYLIALMFFAGYMANYHIARFFMERFLTSLVRLCTLCTYEKP